MQTLIIHNLGPITHCELDVDNFTVLTGYQASGKSTVAKAVYYFKTLKDDIYNLMKKRMNPTGSSSGKSLRREFETVIRNKFLSTFGSSYGMDLSMSLQYCFTEQLKIKIYLQRDIKYASPNIVTFDYSPSLRDYLNCHDTFDSILAARHELEDLFEDCYETVFIPAGRSFLTVLGEQLYYWYITMEDEQKRLLDSCTRDYLERVFRIRPHFRNGWIELVKSADKLKPSQKVLSRATALSEAILKGRYEYSDGEDRIRIQNNRYVKMNFASSGQQEAVWILNLLYFYLLQPQPTFFIIEEPESNLFPASQKYISELIALVVNAGNAGMVTTHSPYVLGEFNNLIYAFTTGQKSKREQTDAIIPACEWINPDHLKSLFVRNGETADCMDHEIQQIDNALLDEISGVINDEFDRLLSLEDPEGGD